MREIVLDTETTGLDPEAGHRVVEIGCLELVNRVPSGRSFQTYLNPERDVPAGAYEVHGLSAEFLAKHPVFADMCKSFLEFIADSPLVIHNAAFDLKFVNAELRRSGREAIAAARAVDTIEMARRKFPGSPASLDALCRRFGIDNSMREKHGALLDAELLAEVYLELTGGRQASFGLAAATGVADTPSATALETPATWRTPRGHAPTVEELAAHETLLTKIKEPIWRA
ncbi:MAG: DNA polymerase III subunit epsilon [Alphaproteobacteria bacterium]